MKKYIIHFITCIFVTASFSSCHEDFDSTPKIEEKNNHLINKDILTLSSDDAIKLATRFATKEYGHESRTSLNRTIKDVQFLTSENNIPLIYIVNYANNNGYTVISATKNYAPILAYSHKGNVNIKNNNFCTNPFINEYKEKIRTAINMKSDSLRQRYAIEWSFFEKETPVVKSRTFTNEEIQQKLADARIYYSNLGYECHSLGAATSLIPAAGGQTAEERANGFIADICEHTAPGYDCMDVNLLLIKRTNEQLGPYLNTIWHQRSPYCADAKYGIAGCATIAVAQMMYYYYWPSTFDWYNISHDWMGTIADLSTAERSFMNSVIDAIDPEYDTRNDTTTIVHPSKMIEALNYFNYNVTPFDYNRELAESYIRQGTPFINFAYKNSDTRYNHYWICDGYKVNKVQYASYMINSDFEDYTFFSGMTDILSEYFHLNMGDGTEPNYAWFYQDNAVYIGENYTKNRKMYILTKQNP